MKSCRGRTTCRMGTPARRHRLCIHLQNRVHLQNCVRHQKDGQECPSYGRRRAFTLLEVMLSLTLATILLGAIYAAMNQSWRLTASGREEMARSQVARALLKRIAQDVRAVMFVPPPPSDGETDDVTGTTSTSTSGTSTGSTSSTTSCTGTTAGTTTDTSTETTETTPSAKSIGIRGTATRIELHISRARRDLDFAANVDGNTLTTRTSDLQAVTYTLGLSGGATAAGLIRSEGDRLIVQAIEEKGGDALTASRSQSLAPEVAALAFRYFDGTAWYTVWDSLENGYLPRAVEVSIGFAPPATRGGPATNVAASSSVNQFRTVILVPVADPFPPELVP